MVQENTICISCTNSQISCGRECDCLPYRRSLPRQTLDVVSKPSMIKRPENLPKRHMEVFCRLVIRQYLFLNRNTGWESFEAVCGKVAGIGGQFVDKRAGVNDGTNAKEQKAAYRLFRSWHILMRSNHSIVACIAALSLTKNCCSPRRRGDFAETWQTEKVPRCVSIPNKVAWHLRH